MASFIAFLSDALVVTGLAILTLGVFGIVRMPDIYLKLHATSKIVLLGLLPILAAAALTGDPAIASRSALIAGLLLLTTPISTHAITKAAYVRGGQDSRSPGILQSNRKEDA